MDHSYQDKEKHRCWIQKTSQRGMFINTSCCKIFIFISFVCAAYENYEAFPVIFRTWIPQWTLNFEPHECTIFEALLATCMPKGIAIASHYGIQSTFVVADLPWNNPLLSVWQEGNAEFGCDKISCIVSIGAGVGSDLPIDSPSRLSDVLGRIRERQNVLSEASMEHTDLTYFRFDTAQVGYSMHLVEHQRSDVDKKADELIDFLQWSSLSSTQTRNSLWPFSNRRNFPRPSFSTPSPISMPSSSLQSRFVQSASLPIHRSPSQYLVQTNLLSDEQVRSSSHIRHFM